LREAIENPQRDTSRVVLPPSSFLHEQEKVKDRWPAAVKFIQENELNEYIAEKDEKIGIILQGGLFNTVNRSLELLGLSDPYGNSQIPLYVLNVTYPIIDQEVLRFCEGKDAVLLVEEGQPDYIEQNINTILRRAQDPIILHGKDLLPVAGEYTPAAVTKGITAFLRKHLPARINESELPTVVLENDDPRSPFAPRIDAELVQGRPPGFCTGCPERPIFAALKLAEREVGTHIVSADIGCHLFSINAPFNLGATTMGYGLGSASGAAFNAKDADKRTIAFMGDGGFWHNGLTSGVGNAVFNENDQLLVIVDNDYSAATGGQDLLSSQSTSALRSTKHPIERAVRGIGVKWSRTMTNTYQVAKMRDLFKEALTTTQKGPKLSSPKANAPLTVNGEKTSTSQEIKEGKRVVRDVTELTRNLHWRPLLHRISGCHHSQLDPTPTRCVMTHCNSLDSCVGCGLCGENAHAAALCPSFYSTEVIYNPNRWDKAKLIFREKYIGLLQRSIEKQRVGIDAG